MNNVNQSSAQLNQQSNNTLKLVCRARSARIAFLMLLSLPLSTWASTQLYLIFQPNEMRLLEWVQLCAASVLFIWMAISFWTSIIGFVISVFNLDPLTLKTELKAEFASDKVTQRHAIIMPVYNESTSRIMAGFEACIKTVLEQNQSSQFDFYMLSDTQNPELAQAEDKMWKKMLAGLPANIHAQCFYRRRIKNSERKVGNLKDFFKKWGYQYCGVIVLDADSIMAGKKLIELSLRLEQNPSVGLIQTIPMPVRQTTFFARFIQFAAQVHSPMLAKGLNFWQGSSANYWGHNAIIRTDAFIQCCGLPALKGRKPFGGDILSHDFVEAALLRRAGWDVFLLTDDSGSYEEVPTNIIDYATRDRRWVQGNMQHLALLRTKGLYLANRLHFGFGAFAYISSIFLLIILFSGTADAILKATTPPNYFPHKYQLFPTWVITPYTLMITTLYVTIGLLFLPKVLGVFTTLVQRSTNFGGGVKFILSALIEFFFAVLVAPVMLMYHSYFVLSTLVGKSVGWEAQMREGKMVPWKAAFSLGIIPTIIAVCWTVLLLIYTPTLLYWLLPVLVGMSLTIPIIRYTSSEGLGVWLGKMGIFNIKQEIELETCIEDVAVIMGELENRKPVEIDGSLPEEKQQDMPTQVF